MRPRFRGRIFLSFLLDPANGNLLISNLGVLRWIAPAKGFAGSGPKDGLTYSPVPCAEWIPANRVLISHFDTWNLRIPLRGPLECSLFESCGTVCPLTTRHLSWRTPVAKVRPKQARRGARPHGIVAAARGLISLPSRGQRQLTGRLGAGPFFRCVTTSPSYSDPSGFACGGFGRCFS